MTISTCTQIEALDINLLLSDTMQQATGKQTLMNVILLFLLSLRIHHQQFKASINIAQVVTINNHITTAIEVDICEEPWDILIQSIFTPEKSDVYSFGGAHDGEKVEQLKNNGIFYNDCLFQGRKFGATSCGC